MLILLILLMLGYALFLELEGEFLLHHFDTTCAQIRVTFAGIHRTWRFDLIKTPQGRRLLLSDGKGTQPVGLTQIGESRAPMLLDVFTRADRARRFLLRSTHLDALDALVLLRTEDAAGSAILTGVAQGVLNALPAVHRENVRIRVWPEFFRAHSTVNARCIIRLRLGTILLTGIMLLAAWFRQQHVNESEAA